MKLRSFLRTIASASVSWFGLRPRHRSERDAALAGDRRFFRFEERRQLDSFFVSDAYRAELGRLVGCRNRWWFRGFAPGECMFLGYVVGPQAGRNCTVIFAFATAPDGWRSTAGPLEDLSPIGRGLADRGEYDALRALMCANPESPDILRACSARARSEALLMAWVTPSTQGPPSPG